MTNSEERKIGFEINHIEHDFNISELDTEVWQKAKTVSVERYWSGEEAPSERHFTVNPLWSRNALYLRFTCSQSGPPIISENPDLTKKTLGLWERDVCEVFVAPDREDLDKYFEFEVAPTGEWVDLAIHQTSNEREIVWEYNSEMKTAARIETLKVIMALRIPWAAFGRTPSAGDIWLGNLFRIVGEGETREYLAWQPTQTTEPDFHMPKKFGELRFVV